MKILVVGKGGREHALVWKIARSPRVRKIYAAPGSPGIASLAHCLPDMRLDKPVSDLDGLTAEIERLRSFALEEGIDLTVVGPEDCLAAGLSGIGLSRGQRVGILTDRPMEPLLLFLACDLLGLSAVPLCAKSSAQILTHYIAHSDMEVLVVDARTFPQVEGVLSTLQSPPRLIVIEGDGGDGCIPWAQLIAAGGSPPEVEVKPENESKVLYTSGSSGLPKAVIQSHANIVANIESVWDLVSLSNSFSFYKSAPDYHAMGILNIYFPLAKGWVLDLARSPERVLSDIRYSEPEGFLTVPLVLDAGALDLVGHDEPDANRPVVLTPHAGELSRLLSRLLGEIITSTIDEAPTEVGRKLGGLGFSETIFTLTQELPYDFGVVTQLLSETDDSFNTGSMRNIYSPDTAVASELVVDQIGRKMGLDPLEVRRRFVKSDVVRRCLDTVAREGRWGRRMPKGMAQGIAVHKEYKGATAVLVEIDCRPETVNRKIRKAVTGPRVTKAVIAVDAGLVINPRGVEAQMQGGFMDGLALTLTSSCHLEDGHFLEASWDNYFYTRQWNVPPEVEVVPPTCPVFSTSRTCKPSSAPTSAAVMPPAPAPQTSRSTSLMSVVTRLSLSDGCMAGLSFGPPAGVGQGGPEGRSARSGRSR